MEKDRAMSDDETDVVELPDGVPESDRECFEAMMGAAKKFAEIPSSLAGTVGIVIRTDGADGSEFRPMILTFECAGKTEDRPHQCRRAVIAMYVDQIHSMVSDVYNGSLRGSFAEVLEDAAKKMREIEADRTPVDPLKAN